MENSGNGIAANLPESRNLLHDQDANTSNPGNINATNSSPLPNILHVQVATGESTSNAVNGNASPLSHLLHDQENQEKNASNEEANAEGNQNIRNQEDKEISKEGKVDEKKILEEQLPMPEIGDPELKTSSEEETLPQALESKVSIEEINLEIPHKRGRGRPRKINSTAFASAENTEKQRKRRRLTETNPNEVASTSEHDSEPCHRRSSTGWTCRNYCVPGYKLCDYHRQMERERGKKAKNASS
ncbi:uncharacterized protein A4U43_C03F16140 [Asparagus officinalis]|uniref:WRC domain-containing protein n=1 Tax=Asparagus officinalis TaxID=4686 RepID=A0A5P1FB19_ASPOF|nr:uncharacterized protein A4U43_C03F16140 [Asparagus officinalis]